METSVAPMLCTSVMILLVAGHQASPVPIVKEQGSINDRQKSRNDQNAVEYMRKLHSSMTDEDGAPLYPETDPTTVWCLLNKDVSTTRPAALSNAWRSVFVFDPPNSAPTVADSELTRAILRPYLQVTVPSNTPTAQAAVRVTVFAKLSEGESFAAVESVFVVGQNSSGWIELNVTAALKKVWFSASVELTVALDVINGTVATLALADSAALAEGTEYAKFQPLLIVHLSDEKLRHKLMMEMNVESVANNRLKRASDAYPEACKIRNYTIVFSDIGLSNVLVPYSYNARKCVGLCSSPYFKGVDDVNNYAVITNSAKAAYSALKPTVTATLPDEYVPPPTAPCCVPTRYGSLSTLTQTLDGSIKAEILGDMQVLSCGCR